MSLSLYKIKLLLKSSDLNTEASCTMLTELTLGRKVFHETVYVTQIITHIHQINCLDHENCPSLQGSSFAKVSVLAGHHTWWEW